MKISTDNKEEVAYWLTSSLFIYVARSHVTIPFSLKLS